MVTESDARQALIALGIVPTRALIHAWLLATQAEQLEEQATNAVSQPTKPYPTGLPASVVDSPARHPRGYSRSQLEPVLRTQGALERQPGPRKRGRPRIIARWFEQVAEAMADGTCLRLALRMCGVTNLDRKRIRALYRNKEFRHMYQEARRKYGRDFFFKRQTHEELFRRGL